jgi:transmembrane E3 ubiquitin-protein ligase
MKFYLAYYIFMFLVSYLIYSFAMRWWFTCLMSLWLLPQIIHNAIKGHPHQMDKPYSFGLMASRLVIILYAKGCPHNLFEFRPNYQLCIGLVLIVAAQLFVYYLQEQRGPRFFVPKCFLPKKFDYFIEIPENIELGQVSSDIQALFNEDCSVCMNPLH